MVGFTDSLSDEILPQIILETWKAKKNFAPFWKTVPKMNTVHNTNSLTSRHGSYSYHLVI
jgi:hypothetical protein